MNRTTRNQTTRNQTMRLSGGGHEQIRTTGIPHDDYKDGAVTKNALQVITIIGEIEGHDNLPATSKATKYEHMLPKLAEIEMDKDIKGVLFIMNTVGGDVSAGLALAEMIASMKKPTVSLIIGDSHSIGVPLAVSTDYSFIVPTATMIIHPVRMNGTLIGVQQTYDYFERISDRITSFIAGSQQGEQGKG